MSEDGSDEVVTSLSAVDLNQAVGGVLKLLQKIPQCQRHLAIRTVCELSGYGVGGMMLGSTAQSLKTAWQLGGIGRDTVQQSGVLDGGGKADQAG